MLFFKIPNDDTLRVRTLSHVGELQLRMLKSFAAYNKTCWTAGSMLMSNNDVIHTNVSIIAKTEAQVAAVFEWFPLSRGTVRYLGGEVHGAPTEG